jgi:hypothetical protein
MKRYDPRARTMSPPPNIWFLCCVSWMHCLLATGLILASCAAQWNETKQKIAEAEQEKFRARQLTREANELARLSNLAKQESEHARRLAEESTAKARCASALVQTPKGVRVGVCACVHGGIFCWGGGGSLRVSFILRSFRFPLLRPRMVNHLRSLPRPKSRSRHLCTRFRILDLLGI